MAIQYFNNTAVNFSPTKSRAVTMKTKSEMMFWLPSVTALKRYSEIRSNEANLSRPLERE